MMVDGATFWINCQWIRIALVVLVADSWFKLDQKFGHNFKKQDKQIDFKFSTYYIVQSGKENVRFPDSPDFQNLPDFRTGRDVR